MASGPLGGEGGGMKLLVAHVALVVLGLGYSLLSVVAHDTPDANLGAGLGLLWVGLLGSPWSWPLWDSRLSVGMLVAGVTASALANVALHLLLRWWLRRRTSVSG